MNTTTENINTTTEARITALAAHMGYDAADFTPVSYTENAFSIGREEYLVLTDEEADEAVSDRIKDDVWAFNASFILSECELPSELEEAISAFQADKCEGANDALLALVEKCCEGGMEAFAESAVSADGRGHFLSSYDGNEIEAGAFFIYRTN